MAIPPSVRTSEIYWGALPWVGLQLLMVAAVIALPQLVTMFFTAAPAVDMDKAGQEVLQQIERALNPGAPQ